MTSKNEWGPLKWREIHTLATRNKINNKSDREKVNNSLHSIIASIPCEECRRHAVEYTIANPPIMDNHANFSFWTWKFHNDVNRRIKKKEMSFSDFRKTYPLK